MIHSDLMEKDEQFESTSGQCQYWIKIRKNTLLTRDDKILDGKFRCRNSCSAKDSEYSLCAIHRITTKVQGYDDDVVVTSIKKEPNKEEKFIDYTTFKRSAILYY